MRATLPVRFLALVFVVMAMNPAPTAIAEENLTSIFLKPVPAELSEKIEAGIKAIETKYPLDLVSRRSLVLAFAVRTNSKNERVYFLPDSKDVEFMTEDVENFLVTERSHTSLALMQFRAVGAGALPYLAQKLAVPDAEKRNVAFGLLSSMLPRSKTKYSNRDSDEQMLCSALLSRCLLDNSVNIRAFAAFWIGRLGIDSAAPELVILLNDENEKVREMAARGLQALGHTDAIPPDMLKKINELILD